MMMDPPWSMSIKDEAPLTLICQTHGRAAIVGESSGTVWLGQGDVALTRGTEHYVFADDPDTRAGQRSQRDREMPATASAMPSTRPITDALTVRINVFGRPVLSRSGMACLYKSQLRNESFSCDSVDFGVAAVDAGFWFCTAIAAKSGSWGAGAAFDPGFHPGGKA